MPVDRPPRLPIALAKDLERTAKDPDMARRRMAEHLEARASGDVEAAYRAAVRAKQVAPRSAAVREALGVAAFERRSWHEAAQELLAFRRLTGRRDRDPLIAECYRQLGRAGRALEFLSSLPRESVSRSVWIDGQVVRARALADSGRGDVAISILEALRVDPASERASDRRALRTLAELRAR